MRTIGILLLAGLLAGCSDDDGNGPSDDCSPSGTQVCMNSNSFDPSTLTITAGASVTWANGDGQTHNTTSNPGNPVGCPSWSETVGLGGTSDAVAFLTGGISCQYFCSIHATATTGAMRGTVTVQ
jgi:plastocyanin